MFNSIDIRFSFFICGDFKKTMTLEDQIVSASKCETIPTDGDKKYFSSVKDKIIHTKNKIFFPNN